MIIVYLFICLPDLKTLFIRCGASFAIEIVSEQFEGKRLLERHRLVNSALEEQMKDIHALSIKKALTPAQWQPQDEPKEAESASH